MVVARRYRLDAWIGRGGSASVWRASDLIDGGRVALKFLRGRPSATRLQARREVATLRALQVPGVVPLRDEGVEHGVAFLVMEVVPGAPFPGRPTRRSWGALAPLVFELLETLARVHALGVVHGDLKPENVLVHRGRVVLLDFGNASTGRAPDDGTGLRGTPSWMAPEAWCGELTPRTDLYAVGALVHHALTGRLPHITRGGAEARRRAGVAHPPSTRWREARGMPPRHARLWDAVLAARPEDRPASAMDLLGMLREGVAPAGEAAEPLGTPVSEDELRTWFEGPERLLHLPEDAARSLHVRCAGDRAEARRVLEGWERDGYARRVGARYAVRREDLDRLESRELPSVGRGSFTPLPAARLDPTQQDLVEWVALANGSVTTGTLAGLTGMPEAELLVRLGSLAAGRAVVEVSPGAWAVPVGRISRWAAGRWAAGRRRDAHRDYARALPADAPGRLTHVLLGDLPVSELADALVRTATRMVSEGHVAQAEEVLLAGVGSLTANPQIAAAHLEPVFVLWFHVVLQQYVPRALDRLSYALCAASMRHRDLRPLDRLARAAQGWPRANVSPVARLAAFRDPGRELLRREVRLYAARGRPDLLRLEVASLARSPFDDPSTARLLATWQGHLAYLEHRFQDSVRLHLKAADDEPWVPRRCRALLNASAAAIESNDLTAALGFAEEVRALAERLRLPPIEARAVYLLHQSEWRRGGPSPPDLSWAEAARRVDPQSSQLLAVQHAVRAWQARDRDTFTRAHALVADTEGYRGHALIRPMLDAMRVDLGLLVMTPRSRDRTVRRVAERVPRLALQIAALTHSVGPLHGAVATTLRAAVAAVPPSEQRHRLDLTSAHDARVRLGL